MFQILEHLLYYKVQKVLKTCGPGLRIWHRRVRMRRDSKLNKKNYGGKPVRVERRQNQRQEKRYGKSTRQHSGHYVSKAIHHLADTEI